MSSEHGGTSLALRKRFAAAAFTLSATYDSAIASWFAGQLDDEGTKIHLRHFRREACGIFNLLSVLCLPFCHLCSKGTGDADSAISMAPNVVSRMYKPEFALKYGCNPHQNPGMVTVMTESIYICVMCVCCNSHPLALLCGISGHSLDNH
jgi:phosphoribosylaminoimidazolecarboxamide formyltransferase/IMP cyclohydrolase